MAILGDSTAISMNVLNTVEVGTIKRRGGTSSQFLKADGSVSTHSGMDKVGTVTSVAASAGAGISVSGSPITSSGTLTITNTGVRSVTAGSTANVIKVNTNGADANITINNVAHATSADSATTATNLANKPSLTWSKATSASAGSTLKVTAGGKESDLITIDKVRSAFTADSATNATNATTATNLANKPTLTWTAASSASAGSTLKVTAGGKESDLITIDKVRAAFTADSATKATQDGSGNTITSTYVKKSGDTMTGALTATSFVKSGGTASQVLMADGSVKTLSTTVTQNDANPVTSGAVWSFCDEFEEVTATALNYLNLSKQDKLTAGSGIALTQASGSAIISIAGVPREVLSATHAGLVQLRNNNRLVPGQWYRITDYTCTTTQANTQSAGHVFDILVMATSYNTLAPDAYACHHEGDTYFANSNLSAWKLWYCLDNDTNKFAWVDATNGKGVIYRLIDEFNNDIPYDFKNIRFKHPKDTTSYPYYYYTFASTITEDNTDASLNFEDVGVYNNTMGLYIVGRGNIQDLNKNVFLGNNCYNNTFGINCYNNAFGTRCSSNTFGNNCSGNTSGNSFFYNTFGSNCSDNTFSDFGSHNTFGDSCSDNIFGKNFSINTFGSSCSNNTFELSCSNNTFGNKCDHNTFGSSCDYNIFGGNCDYNIFGGNCSSNTFGSNCDYNTFGSNCSFNTFGNSCKNIKFTNSNGAKYSYYRNNHFGDGCQYLYFTGAGTASTNARVQNYNFAQGLNTVNSSSEPSYQTVTGIRSRLYQTYVITNTNNTLRYITITNASITVAS